MRDTNAYFMTDNNTVITVQVGTTAALRCQVFDVAEHETVSVVGWWQGVAGGRVDERIPGRGTVEALAVV